MGEGLVNHRLTEEECCAGGHADGDSRPCQRCATCGAMIRPNDAGAECRGPDPRRGEVVKIELDRARDVLAARSPMRHFEGSAMERGIQDSVASAMLAQVRRSLRT